METGDSHIGSNQFIKDPSLDQNRIKQSHAVLNLRGNGLGILVLDHHQKKVLALGDYHSATPLENEGIITFAENTLHSLGLKLEECLSVSWIFSGSRASLLPQEFFTPEKAGKVLELTCRLMPDEVVHHDIWNKHQVASVYPVPRVLEEWLQNFEERKLIHSSTALQGLAQLYKYDEVFALLIVEEGYAELYLSVNGRPVFYNQFPYAVEEDLLYYLLFALEQNRILAPEIDLKIAGKSPKGKKLDMLLSEYIGSVAPLAIPDAMQLSPGLTEEQLRSLILLTGVI